MDREALRRDLQSLEIVAIDAAVELIFEHINSVEKRIMALVEVQQEQLDSMNTSLAAQGTAINKLVADNGLIVDLVVNLRAALATALASGTPPTVVDLTQAIASIDSVTKQLSDATTTDEALLNPPPAPVPPPAPPAPDPAAASPAAPITVANDLNPTPGAATGIVADHPGNAAPAVDMAVVQQPDGSVIQTTADAAQATAQAQAEAGNDPMPGVIIPAGGDGA